MDVQRVGNFSCAALSSVGAASASISPSALNRKFYKANEQKKTKTKYKKKYEKVDKAQGEAGGRGGK